MKFTKLLFGGLTMLCIATLLTQCNTNQVKTTFTDTVITPVPLPVVVPGFKFPEDSNKIYSWFKPYDSTSVYKHAWGIWAGLTAQSGQTYEGDSLLVYQTWLGIAEIQNIIKNDSTNGKILKTNRSPLEIPSQLKNSIFFKAAARKLKGTIDTTAGEGNNFWVSVSYDPNAANHTIKNALLKQSVLDGFLKKDSIGSIPPFPSNSITTKPVYFVGHKKDSLIRINVWPGPPPTPQAFGPSSWNSYVYADVYNKHTPGRQLIPVTGSNPTPAQIEAATCNVSDFINFKINKAMAEYFNEQQTAVQGAKAEAGDIAILVAMHVTSKEVSNWTWQTFYWAPNPANPFSPSSTLAASLTPPQLSAAAAHYALSTAYVMVTPNQPITGGTNKGVSAMIGYNPYLEAGFDSTFNSGNFTFKNAFNPNYIWGVQTNCMSCHALASPQAIDVQKVGDKTNTASIYTTDQYVNMNDPFFKNKVQLDFAWSIQAAIIQDKVKKDK